MILNRIFGREPARPTSDVRPASPAAGGRRPPHEAVFPPGAFPPDCAGCGEEADVWVGDPDGRPTGYCIPCFAANLGAL